ncbi:DUF4301 family protein [Fulvivirga sp. M361]|uniref:DUF4301 family protein n=1 Tax=Fulvivirga sp. M361 TaxID=2594266 RepID=UPI00117BAF10|nr:DUF4301 family protein [Fulvivirga sp. M361]TRX51308.1 DUF4301 family protein [Fulvivirga sp. M361]
MEASFIEELKKAGADVATVKEQLEYFKTGFPFLSIVRSASIGDGIRKLESTDIQGFMSLYEKSLPTLQALKFVPASGAASRMFKLLFEYLEEDESKGASSDFIQKFINGLDHFAFVKSLEKAMEENGDSLAEARSEGRYHSIVKALLTEDGLNYGQLPKALLQFHNYGSFVRTPVQEHFKEGVEYARGSEDKIRLHFTVSPEHQKAFEAHVEEAKSDFSDNTFEVSFSQQKKSTDTIAVTMNNEPFYNDDGQILFRPAGHGALLENLNDINADIIFIKNIDNVVPDHLKEETIRFKKALAGLLLSVRNQVFDYLSQLDAGADESLVKVIENYLTAELMVDLPKDYPTRDLASKATLLHNALNRPIRACGIVENTGEPGGGPFWVAGEGGRLSLQIAETSQIDPDDEMAMSHLKHSTHFSPTDLVCSVKNYKNDKFDLLQYRDPKTGFITEKSKSGRRLKALELPGLWNGSMAGWITLFVEVPLITFNPVKTINDLLRAEHQGA